MAARKPPSSLTLSPLDNRALANLCGPLDANLRQIEAACDVAITHRGGTFTIAGEPAGTIRGAWYPYTYPMNLTGHPALSMPCGKSRGGLPIGLQLVARWHDDRFLLGVAALLEAALKSTA